MLLTFLTRALLVAFRIGGLMTFAPFFSNVAVPARAKAGLTIFFAFLLVPVYSSAPIADSLTIPRFAAMALGEILLGLMIGFTTQFVFEGMDVAGQIVGFQFGFSLVTAIDPTTDVETTVLASFHEFVALLIFMQLGAHRWLVRAVASSFQLIPLGHFGSAPVSAPEILKMAGVMFVIGAEIAFPVLFVTMVIDLTIGFLSKASPQFPAIFFGISAKTLLGLAVLYGVIAFWPVTLERYFFHALANLESLLSLAR